MKILLIAPQPFYTERGTPIAVRCLLAEFSRRGWDVDLLTYHEGQDVEIPRVRLFRIPRLPGVNGIGPGLSFKKVIADIAVFVLAVRLAARGRYRYVHAVEEAAFMAVALRRLFKLPFVYDMDSSVAEQIVERRPRASFLLPVLRWFESRALRRAAVVVAVCESLARIAKRAGAARTIVLTDPPAFAASDGVDAALRRTQLGLCGTCFMYAGNLEPYQGVDLLLQAFAIAVSRGRDVSLLMVGGKPSDVAAYREQAQRLGVLDRTRFLGPKPLGETASFAASADVLVSPRKAGVNTPMKIYAYLNAGKPILATDIESHSQVLTPGIAMLAAPQSESFADAMCRLADDPRLRRQLAERAAAVAREKYSQQAFEATVARFCEIIEAETSAA